MAYPAAMTDLIQELEKLPGIGPRTAERLAWHLLRPGADRARELAAALSEAATSVQPCSRCFHLSDQDPCAICSDPARERSRLLVVEHPKDLEAMEKAGWKGVYHVLVGSLGRQDGARPGRPEDMTLDVLAERLQEQELQEVVVGTNPDLEGDGNALFLVDFIGRVAGERLTVSRLARGVPTGASLEYTNPAVLAEAIQERRPAVREAE